MIMQDDCWSQKQRNHMYKFQIWQMLFRKLLERLKNLQLIWWRHWEICVSNKKNENFKSCYDMKDTHNVVWMCKRTKIILFKLILSRMFLLFHMFDHHARNFTHELDASRRWILCQLSWRFLKISVVKYTSKRVQAHELISENLSHTRQNFFRMTFVLFKLSSCKSCQKHQKWRDVKIEECQNWRECHFWSKIRIWDLVFLIQMISTFNLLSICLRKSKTLICISFLRL